MIISTFYLNYPHLGLGLKLDSLRLGLGLNLDYPRLGLGLGIGLVLLFHIV